ncbi:hypothetical protein TanjilG_05996 [Lupinus angustifolius]|uniref:Auxin-induced protein n=2 Tax=Lupinus angustifolius TaxID=3871 RepID=A0A4P1RE97_LUPAN|nr:hypothetical protein TanjilG_05996 [Lupinus angustifolius]
MNGGSRNEVSPKLLDLISNEKEWNMNKSEGKCSDERKLELKLGPPSGEDWCEDKMKNINNTSTERDESLFSLSYFSNNGFQKQNLSTSDTPSKSILPSSWSSSTSYHHQHKGNNKASSFLVMGNDASKAKVVELQNGAVDKKMFSSPSSANTAVLNNTSQKRNAPTPMVGWPPIRSFRKNLASSSTSKPPLESSQQQEQHDKVVGKKHVDNYGNGGKGLFVKINMDGVPIGRKVDLNAYYSYENLSSSVDELFRDLLAAQRDSSAGGVNKKKEEEKPIMGLLDGSGEYTLVYEDNEGDRMLVGDVPWQMFISTVKRLRVLKSTELSAFTFGSKQEKISTESTMK